jgi:hypothetical protein
MKKNLSPFFIITYMLQFWSHFIFYPQNIDFWPKKIVIYFSNGKFEEKIPLLVSKFTIFEDKDYNFCDKNH